MQAASLEAETIENYIQLADPIVPPLYQVVEHRGEGAFRWDSDRVMLYWSPRQREDRKLRGHELRNEMFCLPAMNVNVLQFLEEHPQYIPDDWRFKQYYLFAWGTIVETNKKLFVPYLQLGLEHIATRYSSLEDLVDKYCPALVRRFIAP